MAMYEDRTSWEEKRVKTKKRKKRKGKKEETERKIRLLGVASNNGSGPSNWQWRGGEREKGNGGVPGCRSPGSSLDLHGCGWSSLSPGSVPDSRVPLPRVGTRIYYSAACFTSGAETMVKTRVETGRSAYVRGPLLLVDLPPLPLASFLSSTPPRRLEGGVDARVRWSIFVACVMAGDRYRLVSFPEGFFFEKGERKLGCAIIDLQHESGIFF